MQKSPIFRMVLLIWPFVLLDAGICFARTTASLSVEELVTLNRVRSVHLSPAGEHIAYRLTAPRGLSSDAGQPAIELYVIDLQGRPTANYTGALQIGAVAWSTDGERLLFTGRKRGDHSTGIYSLSPGDGAVSEIYLSERAIEAIYPSPDGAWIAYLAAAPKSVARSQLGARDFDVVVFEEDIPDTKVWLLNTETGVSQRQHLAGSTSSLAWRPDSKTYAVSQAPTGTADDDELARDLVVVDPADSQFQKRMGLVGKLSHFAWSPDGKQLAYIGGEDAADPNPGRLFVIEIDSGKPVSLLADYPGQVEDFHWLDNERIGYIGSRGVWTEYAIASSNQSSLQSPAPDGGPILRSLSAGSDVVVAVADTPDHPPEVYRLELNEEPQRLTFSNPGLAKKELAKQSVVRFKARDGLDLEAILVHPITTNGPALSPLIVFAHSGPESHYANGWLTSYHTPAQSLAAEGYLLAFPNYRGSTGRGVDYSKLSQNDPAGGEFDDLVDTKTHLVDAGMADAKRTGIAGFSYGGYAAMWGATALTEHFSAAVALAGMSNYVSNFGSTDIPNEWFQVHSLAWPWDDWQGLLQHSPIYYAAETQTPLLIANGDGDRRYHPSQSLEMYRHIKLRSETPVRLVVYPGEGHGISNTQAQIDYALRLVRWMNHYLQGAGGTPPPFEVHQRSTFDETGQ